ncbi:uracil-DNA glycosylase family protein [uncultured Methylophaga sp.]|uniref:uracil-DNA glycosylase family protein n=1 Tax=uncultured Methylophaga sp. TaxID=285271 RepID=UPI00262A9954|nr:uracil-DNA glycosylase family protein [uncultured Methylophaga sp.]
MQTAQQLISDIRDCTLCRDTLPLGPRPVIQFSPEARILIAGQAPGRKVHQTGVAFDDASGDQLRNWLGINREQFYDATKVAILPMGFCYPGSGNNGDLPPRPECAETWREQLLAHLNKLDLILIIGQYALKYHLPQYKGSVTNAVKDWHTSWPRVLPMPHPSPRNRRWLKQHPWFEQQVLPVLRQRVSFILHHD